MERWVHLQLGVPTERAYGAARNLARVISVRGIKGHEMFRKGFEASVKSIEGYFGEALTAIVRALGD